MDAFFAADLLSREPCRIITGKSERAYSAAAVFSASIVKPAAVASR